MAVEDFKARNQVTVVVRIRPLSKKERDDIKSYAVAFATDGSESDLSASNVDASEKEYQSVTISNPNENYLDSVLNRQKAKSSVYGFDSVFGPESSQKLVYNCTVARYGVVEDVLCNRLNCTLFVYGATGAGKTYTMMGDSSEPGIVSQTFSSLFDRIDELQVGRKAEYSVQFSYIEIYNEVVRDLLSPIGMQKLDMREDGSGEIVVANMTMKTVNSTDEVLELVRQGNEKRATESTNANEVSSRSHAVLQVYVACTTGSLSSRGKEKAGADSRTVYTKLSLIDLAGSERAKNTNNQGVRMVEGANINRSLLALANCINKLAATSTATALKFVNYRDSKLTRLLKDSLSGKCKTIMIANLSPANTSYDESFNTLAYASRLRNTKPTYQFVANEPVVKPLQSTAVLPPIVRTATQHSLVSIAQSERNSASKLAQRLMLPTLAKCPSPTRQFFENLRDISLNERANMEELSQLMERLERGQAERIKLEAELERLNNSNGEDRGSVDSSSGVDSSLSMAAYAIQDKLETLGDCEKSIIDACRQAKDAVDDTQSKLDYLRTRLSSDLPTLSQIVAQLLLENQALYLAHGQYSKLLTLQDALLECQEAELSQGKSANPIKARSYQITRAIKRNEIEKWKKNSIYSDALEKSYSYRDGNIVEKINAVLSVMDQQQQQVGSLYFSKDTAPLIKSQSNYGSFAASPFRLQRKAGNLGVGRSRTPISEQNEPKFNVNKRRSSVPSVPPSAQQYALNGRELFRRPVAHPSMNDLRM